MIRSNFFRQAGVTLTELLVVLVIVSILATIAVPVYINKAENARIAVAEAECREIADAEETCAAHHGFYVPLQLLDDMPPNSTNRTDSDSLERESSQIYLVDTAVAYYRLNVNQPQLSPISPDPRVQNLIRTWQGPFLNPQRVFKGNVTSGDPSQLLGDLNRMDYPLDPWGQPYRFYAPEPFGLIGNGSISTDPSTWRSFSFSDGQVTQLDNNRGFDRFVIVSYGPDGISNSNSVDRQDDIMYFFGRSNAIQSETDSANGNTVIVTPEPTSSTPTPDPGP